MLHTQALNDLGPGLALSRADSPGTVNGPTGPNPITKFTSGQDILGFDVTYVFN